MTSTNRLDREERGLKRPRILFPDVAWALLAAASGVLAGRFIGERLPVRRYTVDGASMEPAYSAGDRVLVNRWAYRGGRTPQIGDVVVVHDPERPGRYLLKRVAATPANVEPVDDLVFVLGDNTAASHDSRAFGPLPMSSVIGRAWLKY